MINDQFYLSGKRPITRLSSLEIQSNTAVANGYFTSSLTTAQRDAIPDDNLRNGGFIYNSDLNNGNGLFQFYQNSTWLTMPSGGIGNVTGPANSTVNNIAIWGNTSGTLLRNSGVAIAAVIPPLMSPSLLSAEGFVPNDDVNEISSLGHIKFSNSNGVGLIFLDSLVAAHYIEHSAGAIDNVCTVITGGSVADGSGSASAILELDSTTGCILHSRATTTQINAFSTPQNGMQVYNTTTGRMVTRESGSWLSSYAPGYPTFIADSGIGGNFFIGTNAGNNTVTGVDNFGAGLNALHNLTEGFENVAIMGGGSLTTGSKCVSIGSGSLLFAEATQRTIAIGFQALASIITNGWSIAIGAEALRSSTASFNIGIGDQAGRYITLGTDTLCIGNLAGPTAANNISSRNIFIGNGATTTSTTVSNAIAIGYNAVVDAPDAIILGDGCNAGIGTSRPLRGVHLGGGVVPQVYMESYAAPTASGLNANDGIFGVTLGVPKFASGVSGGQYTGTIVTANVGKADVTNGVNAVLVNTSTVRSNSIILLTTNFGTVIPASESYPTIAAGHILDGVSFTIYLNPTSNQNVTINWLIINP